MRSARTAVRSFTMAGKTSSAPSIPPAANSTDSSLNPQAKAHQLPTDFPDEPQFFCVLLPGSLHLEATSVCLQFGCFVDVRKLFVREWFLRLNNASRFHAVIFRGPVFGKHLSADAEPHELPQHADEPDGCSITHHHIRYAFTGSWFAIVQRVHVLP